MERDTRRDKHKEGEGKRWLGNTLFEFEKGKRTFQFQEGGFIFNDVNPVSVDRLGSKFKIHRIMRQL
jgi:hypothetical protein